MPTPVTSSFALLYSSTNCISIVMVILGHLLQESSSNYSTISYPGVSFVGAHLGCGVAFVDGCETRISHMFTQVCRRRRNFFNMQTQIFPIVNKSLETQAISRSFSSLEAQPCATHYLPTCSRQIKMDRTLHEKWTSNPSQ